MKVSLKDDWRQIDEHQHRLTDGNVYVVIGIEADWYRIVTDAGRPVLFPPEIFDVVSADEPEEWIESFGDDGERYAYPPELDAVGFFEDYHDDDQETIRAFQRYLKRAHLAKGGDR